MPGVPLRVREEAGAVLFGRPPVGRGSRHLTVTPTLLSLLMFTAPRL
jgi:hypothetical protein